MTEGGSPPIAFLERAIPRILTGDGRLVDDERGSPPSPTTAASTGPGSLSTAGLLGTIALRPALVAKVSAPPVAFLGAKGSSAQDALQAAKQRALALADALSVNSGPTAGPGTRSQGDGIATEHAKEDDCCVAAEAMEDAAHGKETAGVSELRVQQHSGAGKGSDTAEASAGGGLVRLLRDYADDGDGV